MFHPTRGGVRGGRDQFKWDDVKGDKDRFNYLGNSLKAPVKKPWDQGPEAGWYVNGSGDVGIGKTKPVAEDGGVESIETEKERIKAMEAEYMASVLSKGFGFNKAQNTVPVQMVTKFEDHLKPEPRAKPRQSEDDHRRREKRERLPENGDRHEPRRELDRYESRREPDKSKRSPDRSGRYERERSPHRNSERHERRRYR